MSVKTGDNDQEDDIKHLIIQEKKRKFYFLKERRFNSLPELVSFYSRHSLGECFDRVDTKLTQSIGEVQMRREQQELQSD